MKSKIRIVLIVLVVIVIGVVGFSTYLLLNKEESSPDGIELPVEEVRENEVVLQNETSKTSEGNKIPDDLDLKGLIPAFPPTAKRLNVIDTDNENFRKVILKYQVTKKMEDLRNYLLDDLNSKQWDSVVEESNGIILAIRGDSKVSIDIQEVDDLKLLSTVTVHINKSVE